MWNVISVVQDLNSCHRVHFLRDLLCLSVCMGLSVFVCIYPTPPHEQHATQYEFFMRGLTGLNSEFTFSGCHTKVKELSLPYYFTNTP